MSDTNIRKIRVNNGGYDSMGSYWGVGPALYQINSDDADLDGRTFRLNSSVSIHPATDLFMRGVKGATITKVGRKYLTVTSWMHDREFKVSPHAIDWR